MRFVLFALFTALVFVSGCAGVQRYPTGLPAHTAPKFYFHLENEAEARGYEVWRKDDRQELDVRVPKGYLQYGIGHNDDEIELIITVEDADEMSDQEIADRQAELKALSDDLTAAARARAEEANVFE